MTAHTSLLELTNRLLHDEASRSAFAADPDGFLVGHGIVDLTPAEVSDGLGHVADALPPHLAVQLGPSDGGDVGTLVEQFRVVTEIDPELALAELEPDGGLPEATDPAEVSDPDATDDVDPHGLLDDPGASEGADETRTPEAPSDDGADRADDVSDDADLGFGSGGDDAAAAVVGDQSGAASVPSDLVEDADAFPSSVPAFDDPAAFDESAGFADPYLAPEPVERDPGDPDDLDADNGDWDGSWDHDDGHGML